MSGYGNINSPQAYQSYQSPYGAYSPQSAYYAQASPANMAAVQAPPAYGSPGSFSGRKPMQPPGGFSSLSIGDGSGYSPYSRYGAYQGSAGGAQYGSPTAAGYGQQQVPAYSPGLYQPNQTDLTTQLNLPSHAQRRPPSSGRRAGSQSSAYDASTSYGTQPTASAYNQYPSTYNQASAAAAYPSTSSYTYGAASNAYGASIGGAYGGGGASAYNPSSAAYQPSSPTAITTANYRSPAYSSGYGYGSSAAQGAGYEAPQYGSGGYGGAGAYGGGAGYGAGSLSSPTSSRPAGYLPQPVVSPTFQAGQKGQFCGKIIMQPPGGKTSINLFG